MSDLPSLPPLPESASNLMPDEPADELAPIVGRTATAVRPGWATSEFWLSAVGMVALTSVATVGLLTDRLSGGLFAVLVFVACVVAPALYCSERGEVKKRAMDADARADES